MDATPARAIAVLSFDAAMFEQGQRCLESVRSYCARPLDVGVVALGLSDSQLGWLKQQGVLTFSQYQSLPFYSEGPAYAYAMTCRPYLTEIFPGYELYMWIDADVRFAHADAFEFYLNQAAAEPHSIVIAQELDPAYCFLQNPPQARLYHTLKHSRILRTYGLEAADYMQFFQSYNAGVFAMHRDAPTWNSYRRNLEIAMKGPFDHMAEQDALTLSIVHDGLRVRVAPTIMNWLCSIRLPVFHAGQNRWVRPEYPHLPISVLHLTNSSQTITVDGAQGTYYELYKRLKLTA